MRNFRWFLGLVLALVGMTAGAQEVLVRDMQVPVVLDRDYNLLTVLKIDIEKGENWTLDDVTVEFEGLPKGALKEVRLMYTGAMSPVLTRTTSQAIRVHYSIFGPSQNIYADPSYALCLGSSQPGKGGEIRLDADGKVLKKGANYLYINASFNGRKVRDLSVPFKMKVKEVRIGGVEARLNWKNENLELDRRFAVGLRNHGDDGVFAFRIPGLVTTVRGSLVAVYDARYHTTRDLQEDIDVAMSRSVDGGRSWEKMKIIMDMGEWGGLPQAQNGIGDPAVLVDEATGEIFVVAVWTHGLDNDRAWSRVGDGFEPEETAQLMIVSSKDDGRTWSEPRNITRQVKHESWRFTLQGPGRGICMKDGTLVFPIQYVDSTGVPNAGIMYSLDHGQTWACHGHAWTNTTESQVAEVEPGVLMLNMRNNRRTGRVVCTTTDLGRNWTVHPSSETLREPVCMAGLLQVPAAENVTGQDILLFSNPDTVKGRSHITIKASLDGGLTWQHSLLLDEEECWGYSCLTMIDSATVGILYEGSVSQLVFQAIPLCDILGSD